MGAVFRGDLGDCGYFLVVKKTVVQHIFCNLLRHSSFLLRGKGLASQTGIKSVMFGNLIVRRLALRRTAILEDPARKAYLQGLRQISWIVRRYFSAKISFLDAY